MSHTLLASTDTASGLWTTPASRRSPVPAPPRIGRWRTMASAHW
ncbi:hypothetical protein [Streptomyces sp. NPDC046942]